MRTVEQLQAIVEKMQELATEREELIAMSKTAKFLGNFVRSEVVDGRIRVIDRKLGWYRGRVPVDMLTPELNAISASAESEDAVDETTGSETAFAAIAQLDDGPGVDPTDATDAVRAGRRALAGRQPQPRVGLERQPRQGASSGTPVRVSPATGRRRRGHPVPAPPPHRLGHLRGPEVSHGAGDHAGALLQRGRRLLRRLRHVPWCQTVQPERAFLPDRTAPVSRRRRSPAPGGRLGSHPGACAEPLGQ